jgi:hypothetical protein
MLPGFFKMIKNYIMITIARSAITGRFVSRSYAATHRSTTVTETVRRRKVKKKK